MKSSHRREFMKKTASLLTAASVVPGISLAEKVSKKAGLSDSVPEIPDNPLILFDNFHSGNRRSYSLKSRFEAAKYAGFDGFEFVSIDPSSDAWKEAMTLKEASDFSVFGLHWTTNTVVDKYSNQIDSAIASIEKAVEACADNKINYMTLSLSGTEELSGPSISESGSAKAEERHWLRAYKIISAFDSACESFGVTGSLYPHTHWICDTPESQIKIFEGAQVKKIGPAFCSHHWYANKAAAGLEQVLQYPIMEKLNYVVMTNGKFSGVNFPAVRFDEGEIDMAWILAHIIKFGYKGPISSQGWAIGGDPLVSCKLFVDSINGLKRRFREQPQLWPL